MKSAEEWVSIRVAGLWGNGPESSLVEFIHAIQGDALDSMAQLAKTLERWEPGAWNDALIAYHDAIQAEADKLKLSTKIK